MVGGPGKDQEIASLVKAGKMDKFLKK